MEMMPGGNGKYVTYQNCSEQLWQLAILHQNNTQVLLTEQNGLNLQEAFDFFECVIFNFEINSSVFSKNFAHSLE